MRCLGALRGPARIALRQQQACRAAAAAPRAQAPRRGAAGGAAAPLPPRAAAAGATGVSQPDAAVAAMMAQLEQRIGALDNGPMVPHPRPRVVVLSGSSGVGKDSVIAELRRLRPDLHFVITATSRAMRPGEVHGRDYFFVSKQQFEDWIEGGKLLEHAVVYGEYKGIPMQQVEEALARGTDVVLRLDVQGAATVRKLMPEVISIFLAAESEAALAARLVGRATEPLEKLVTRVQTAREETARMGEFDYVVVNWAGRLEETAAAIAGIIDCEKRRASHLRLPGKQAPAAA
ncbi:guanylate kinase [Raphidocelis subcapitata]|uniref:guanylate kinase n=1 Tax=Raphidocelis subcapitata TaxID=307507 RepID=A0A2V0P727_9CHLO|nr:guanylate kinase [Raphidocelis subcapitata]|eukprot:GBF92997.1 guanylate kinase [Raphidocelis subcapitata]